MLVRPLLVGLLEIGFVGSCTLGYADEASPQPPSSLHAWAGAPSWANEPPSRRPARGWNWYGRTTGSFVCGSR